MEGYRNHDLWSLHSTTIALVYKQSLGKPQRSTKSLELQLLLRKSVGIMRRNQQPLTLLKPIRSCSNNKTSLAKADNARWQLVQHT
jgi:hypothetical protein